MNFTIELKFPTNNENEAWWWICLYGCSDNKITQKQWQILAEMRGFWNRNVAYISGFNVITLNDKK